MEPLTFTVDKFTFHIAADRNYSVGGVWILAVGDRLRLGVSDFVQGHSGDVTFVETLPVGATVARGKTLGQLETIKVTLDLISPATGRILAVNPRLETEAEVVNEDPYGDGWLVELEAADWLRDRDALLTPEAYRDLARAQAEEH